VTVALAIARAVQFASLMVIFGGGAYLLLLRRKLHLSPRAAAPRTMFVIAAVAAFLSAICWLCLASGQISGDWRAAFDLPIVERVVHGTHFGSVFAVRIVGLVLLLAASIGMRACRTETLVVLSAFLLGSLGLTSHAAASADIPAGYIRAANDAVHLLAAGFWIGGLVVLAALIPEHLDAPAELVAPLRLFSLWGTYMVAALVLTGLLNAISILGLSPPRLSAYRNVLGMKVVLAFAMIGLAIVNRLRIAPVLTHEEAAPHRLGQSVTAELVLGIMVIGAAGLLGLLPPE